jgi:hypothetical protein
MQGRLQVTLPNMQGPLQVVALVRAYFCYQTGIKDLKLCNRFVRICFIESVAAQGIHSIVSCSNLHCTRLMTEIVPPVAMIEGGTAGRE